MYTIYIYKYIYSLNYEIECQNYAIHFGTLQYIVVHAAFHCAGETRGFSSEFTTFTLHYIIIIITTTPITEVWFQ